MKLVIHGRNLEVTPAIREYTAAYFRVFVVYSTLYPSSD